MCCAETLPCELLVDDRLERLERLRAAEKATVDEEGRCAGDTDLRSFGQVGADVVLEGAAVETGVELLGVEAESDGVLLVVVDRQGALVGEQQVMELPELPLVVRALRRLGGRLCLPVISERIIAENQADLIPVRLEDF